MVCCVLDLLEGGMVAQQEMIVFLWTPLSIHRQLALDFYDIFQKSHVAMAVVALDGRLLEVNEEFTRVTGMLYWWC